MSGAFAIPTSFQSRGILRHSRWATWDALFIVLAVAHGILLLVMPSIALISIGLWWNANTISHNFIHRPFFRSRALNTIFSWYLSLLLGLPQTLWRQRHLAHHAGTMGRGEAGSRRQDTGGRRQEAGSSRLSSIRKKADTLNIKLLPASCLLPPVSCLLELALVLSLWVGLLIIAPIFTLTIYLPGYLLGLGLCYLQGHYEHARGTVSNYGRLYNLLFFNDGYHVEHHERPGEDWRQLPNRLVRSASVSRLPAVFRWIESLNLCLLERLVLRSRFLQRFVLKRHERAFRRLLPATPAIRRIGIVGGGLFPRTAIILNRLLPQARLILIDMSAENLQTATAFLKADVELVNDCFDSASRYELDLLVIPLAFVGDRAAIYHHPPAPVVLAHDWVWRRRGASVIVSWALLKRLNMVMR